MSRMNADTDNPSGADDATSAASRVRASEQRKIDAGGRRMPGGVMPADAADALDKLKAAGYAPTASACIYRALVEAEVALRHKRR